MAPNNGDTGDIANGFDGRQDSQSDEMTGQDGSDLSEEELLFAAQAGLRPVTVEVGATLATEGWITPGDAQATLAQLPPASRQMLMRAVALYLVLDRVPPLSFPPFLAPVAGPLVVSGLMTPVSAREQAAYNTEEWGMLPDGLIAVGTTLRLIGLIAALLSGTPQDALLLYSQAIEDMARFRLFS